MGGGVFETRGEQAVGVLDFFEACPLVRPLFHSLGCHVSRFGPLPFYFFTFVSQIGCHAMSALFDLFLPNPRHVSPSLNFHFRPLRWGPFNFNFKVCLPAWVLPSTVFGTILHDFAVWVVLPALLAPLLVLLMTQQAQSKHMNQPVPFFLFWQQGKPGPKLTNKLAWYLASIASEAWVSLITLWWFFSGQARLLSAIIILASKTSWKFLGNIFAVGDVLRAFLPIAFLPIAYFANSLVPFTTLHDFHILTDLFAVLPEQLVLKRWALQDNVVIPVAPLA